MIVKQLTVGTMKNFVYLLAERAGGEAIAIDSGWEIDPIIKAAEEYRMDVRFVAATHNHFDHTSTVHDLAKKLGAKVVAHEASPMTRDVSVRDGDVLEIGDRKVRILHTPGHTEDSVCLYDGENLFTGDTLFIGNCGRTDLASGSAERMFRSLHGVILTLPQETMVYPGHDYGDVPFRRLGEEAKLNPTLSARNYAEFLRIP